MQHSDSKQRRHKVIPLLCKNFKWKYRPPINSMTESAVTYKCDRVKKEGGRQTDRQTPGKVCRATIVDGTNVSDSVSPVSSLTLLWLNHWITEHWCPTSLHWPRGGQQETLPFSCSFAAPLTILSVTILLIIPIQWFNEFNGKNRKNDLCTFCILHCVLYHNCASCTTSFRQIRP